MISSSKSDKIFDFFVYFVLSVVLILALYPLIYVVSASLSDPLMVNQGKVWILPKGFTLDGYKLLIKQKDIWLGYKNTILYTLAGTLVNVFLTITCAYPLSRKDFRGRNFFTAIFTFTMFFGGGLIPSYLLIKKLGLMNNFWVMVIPMAVSVWNIIITRTFIQTIPIELQEAAVIDGCSNTGILIYIILPLSAPIIAVMTLFYGVGHWNEFFNALIYLSSRTKYPLQLVLRDILVMQQSTDLLGDDVKAVTEQMRLADLIKYGTIVVSTLPVIMIYPFIQKYFVTGMMIGAIKG